MKLFLSLFISIYIFGFSYSQNQYKSPIWEQYEEYKKHGYKTPKQWDSFHGIKPNSMKRTDLLKTPPPCSLKKDVYGWYPYWVGNAYTNIDYSLISTFSFLGYEVNPSNGQLASIAQPSINMWNSTTGVVQHSLNQGVRVELTVFCFGNSNNATFLGNPTSRQTCITNLVNLVKNRGAHGINVDFENVPLSQKTNLVSFFAALSSQLKAAVPGATVTAACPPHDWDNSWDLPALVPHVDRFIIMGYDFYYAGGSEAGPVGLTYKATGGWATFTNQFIGVNYYLNNGVPKNKLILAFPYYGRDWQVSSHGLPASTINSSAAKSRTYKTVKDNQATYGTKMTHQNLRSNYYNYNDGNLRQLWIDEEEMLREKYDAVNRVDLAGIGIFALGYDDGYNELWDAIKDKFSDCGINECNGRIFDLAGPDGNHYHNLNNTFTISPDNASSIDLNFTQFALGTGDELKIYDGANTSANLLGTYTGNNSPGTFSSTTGDITFNISTNGSGSAAGYDLTYACQTAPPVANFTTSATSYCVGDSVKFTNSSTHASSYEWTFTGGTPASSNNPTPSVSFNTPGTYTIELKAIGNGNNISSKTVTITQPNASISADKTSICPNDTITLTAKTGTQFDWSNGETTSTIKINDTTIYTVTVTDSKGCKATAQSTKPTIYPLPSPNIFAKDGKTEVCQGQLITLEFDSVSNFIDVNWSNGTITNSTKVSKTNTYYVSVTDSNNCIGTDSIDLMFINPNPIIVGDSAFCTNGGQIYVTSTSPLTAVNWNTGQTKDSINADSSGYFFVTVADTNGCQSTSDSVYIYVGNPTADFSYYVDTNKSVMFTNLTQNGTTYTWDFGDGNNSQDKNPNHTYTVDSIVDVMLISNYGKCSDTITKQIHVGKWTSINNGLSSQNIVLFPNPFSESFVVSNTSKNINTIEVFNSVGKRVKHLKNLNSNTVSVDLKSEAKGTYFIKVYIEDKSTSENHVTIKN
jgi:spore germination protein YaaH/PKD repeat protein